jgi:hypothetical protein
MPDASDIPLRSGLSLRYGEAPPSTLVFVAAIPSVRFAALSLWVPTSPIGVGTGTGNLSGSQGRPVQPKFLGHRRPVQPRAANPRPDPT